MKAHKEALRAVVEGRALGPDELAAARKGLVYYDPSDSKHVARATRLFWDAVGGATAAGLVPGSADFEAALRKRFWPAVKAEFELWQAWADPWSGFVLSRALDDGDGDFEDVQIGDEDRDALDYDPEKVPVPDLEPVCRKGGVES